MSGWPTTAPRRRNAGTIGVGSRHERGRPERVEKSPAGRHVRRTCRRRRHRLLRGNNRSPRHRRIRAALDVIRGRGFLRAPGSAGLWPSAGAGAAGPTGGGPNAAARTARAAALAATASARGLRAGGLEHAHVPAVVRGVGGQGVGAAGLQGVGAAGAALVALLGADQTQQTGSSLTRAISPVTGWALP